MRQNMMIGVSQQLGMTPQLARSIRLLQLSAQDLSAELLEALDENLLLEREDEDQPGTVSIAEDGEESLYWSGTRSGAQSDDSNACLTTPQQQDVHMRILQQADLTFSREIDRLIACEICAAVDDSGYLTIPLNEVVERMATKPRPSVARAEMVLWQLQRMEPQAYAARSLKECLLLQLEHCGPDLGSVQAIELATTLVEEHLDAVGAARWRRLAEQLSQPVDAILQAVGLIRKLNPKPAYQPAPVQYVTPDVYVERSDSGWSVRLNARSLPQIRVNPEYARAVERDKGCGSLRTQLQEARWLLRSVQVRQDTLLATTQAIFAKQAGFLIKGDTGLQPLTLKEVADSIGVHESTLSRITSSKYVQTPRGTFSLKHFFPTALDAADGVCASDAAVKTMIRRLVNREAEDSPLRDADIAAIMARRGIKIARRTIAKYREALGIGSSKERLAANRMNCRGQQRMNSSCAIAAA